MKCTKYVSNNLSIVHIKKLMYVQTKESKNLSMCNKDMKHKKKEAPQRHKKQRK